MQQSKQEAQGGGGHLPIIPPATLKSIPGAPPYPLPSGFSSSISLDKLQAPRQGLFLPLSFVWSTVLARLKQRAIINGDNNAILFSQEPPQGLARPTPRSFLPAHWWLSPVNPRRPGQGLLPSAARHRVLPTLHLFSFSRALSIGQGKRGPIRRLRAPAQDRQGSHGLKRPRR